MQVITDTTNRLLTLLQGTGVKRTIISDTRIEFFPRLTDEAIERLTSPQELTAGPDTSLYTAYMRHHYPSTRRPHTFTPGDYDLTGPQPRNTKPKTQNPKHTMNATRLEALHTYLQALRDYFKLNDQFRAAWRYADRRASIAEPRRQAYNLAETRRNQLHQLIVDNPDEPTYLDRQARILIEKWDNRNQQLEIYRQEPNGHNLQHLNEAEKNCKQKSAEIIEIINKTT